MLLPCPAVCCVSGRRPAASGLRQHLNRFSKRFGSFHGCAASANRPLLFLPLHSSARHSIPPPNPGRCGLFSKFKTRAPERAFSRSLALSFSPEQRVVFRCGDFCPRCCCTPSKKPNLQMWFYNYRIQRQRPRARPQKLRLFVFRLHTSTSTLLALFWFRFIQLHLGQTRECISKECYKSSSVMVLEAVFSSLDRSAKSVRLCGSVCWHRRTDP